jgi:TonB family protein
MESPGLYLLKSAVWLTGFALVFLMVLRNERYFRLNRIYLLSGIIASIVFPFYTWHYAVILPSVPVEEFTFSDLPQATAIMTPPIHSIPIYWWFYLVGVAGLALRLIWQTGTVIRKLRKTGYVTNGPVKLVRSSEYAAPFSFFSFVFVNPSTTDIETKEIVNHESGHIGQRHWFDLALVELLCMLQWFNPFVWLYARLVRQNHEYLADEMALQRTSNPAIYQATLLNQMLGGPIISLANSFSYSLNKKRFKMMKKSIDSPFRKLKMLSVLPLIAMVFYAFAKPEYISAPAASTGTGTITTIADALNELKAPVATPVDKSEKVVPVDKSKIVKGKVVNRDGKPWPGTSVILVGSTKGAMTDREGYFELKDVPNDGELMFSFVGYETVKVRPDFKKTMTIQMVPAVVGLDKVVAVGFVNPNGPPPPPPPPMGTKLKPFDDKNPPLFVLDGVIIDKAKMDALNPDNIASMTVLKDQSATDKYGDKGKNGVLLITSKGKAGATNGNEEGDVRVVGFGKSEDYKSSDPALISFQGVAIRSTDPQNPPLYVLDDVIIDRAKMDTLSPNSIASISVLKDKSATALFGDKGKNGAILITSKGKASAANGNNKDNNMVKIGYPIPPNGEYSFIVVEEMPEFPGGNEAMMKFITENIKYPETAKTDKTQGMVIVKFVVKSNGKIDNARIARSVHSALDAEALRVINAMPEWKPGKQRGKAVDVEFTLPVKFTLQ